VLSREEGEKKKKEPHILMYFHHQRGRKERKGRRTYFFLLGGERTSQFCSEKKEEDHKREGGGKRSARLFRLKEKMSPRGPSILKGNILFPTFRGKRKNRFSSITRGKEGWDQLVKRGKEMPPSFSSGKRREAV